MKKNTEWNHNTHYHTFLLNKLPEKRHTALDIGSGFGLFASKLATVFDNVIGIEPDSKSAQIARIQNKQYENTEFIEKNFLEHDFQSQRFDCISAIASLHHMNFQEALDKMVQLLKPGGKLLILGLYKESSVFDFLISLLAAPINLMRTAFLRDDKKHSTYSMITTNPAINFATIKQIALEELKDCTISRHLYWRYSIVWEKAS